MKKTAMAIGAHPDDIEFMMGGTLALLGRAGYETHCLNLANGCCGSAEFGARKLASMRRAEGKAAAAALGAMFHESLVDDLEIYYERKLLARLAALIREVQPSILLAPSPQDYMEDHMNTCRLTVTAAFVRGMKNFKTSPARKPMNQELTLYHAMPHGLRDPLRRRVIPGAFVDTTHVHEIKLAALRCHQSQQRWLETSQGMNQYLLSMEGFAREVGRRSGCFQFAEGWRKRLHYGFCAENADPLGDALKDLYSINKKYEASLERGS
jgi:LmbE family N-acetylglucosaminyl deacetylase